MSELSPGRSSPLFKGLEGGALGLASSIVIGVSSTAPAYSLAVSLGLVAKALGPDGTGAPAVLLVSFVPILCIAIAYERLNRVEPDCGTTFAWGVRSMGPWIGWMGGWGMLAAGIVVMASLAQISGAYSLRLVGEDALAGQALPVSLLGLGWIVLMTWISARGVRLAARTQMVLLAVEIAILAIFSVVSLAHVWGTHPPADALRPTIRWFRPDAVGSTTALAAGVLAAVFIYWGWDSAVSVNEETRNERHTPGVAAVASTLILLAVYTLAATAAQAVHGPGYLAAHSDDVLSALGRDVLPFPLDRLLILAVLTSSVACAQTTILPAARTVLSMSVVGAVPAAFAKVDPVQRSPLLATWVFGVVSAAWYALLAAASADLLADSIVALGLLIAFYYALTGYACPVLFRRRLTASAKDVVLLGVAPLLGAVSLTWVFGRSCVDLAQPGASGTVFGMGVPLAIGLGLLALGALLMAAQAWRSPAFFRGPSFRADANPGQKR